MNYILLTTEDKDAWNKYFELIQACQKDIYFTPEYCSLSENYGDGKAYCFVFQEDEDIALYPYLLNSVNALGYSLKRNYYDIQGVYGYNGVIASTGEDEFRNNFHLAFSQYCIENNIIAEFVRFHPMLHNQIFSDGFMNIIFDRKTVFIDLSQPEETIFSGFQQTTRKQIRRAANRYNLKVRILAEDQTYLENIYDIYYRSMERVKSTPYLFFNKQYFSELLANKNVVQFIAFLDDLPIAAITGFQCGDYFSGHLGGSLKEYFHVYPNSFLYWEMIKFSKSLGCKFLHLGGGDNCEPENLLFKFKQNYSSLTGDFYIGKKIHDEPVYNEVIKQWTVKYPEKLDVYKSLFLKYRF
jgi:hypothetical protein